MATQVPTSATKKIAKSTTAKKKTATPKVNPDGTTQRKKKKPYNLSPAAIARRGSFGEPQYQPLSGKDKTNASKFFTIMNKAPKKYEVGKDGVKRRVIADTNMRIMARQVMKNIQTLQQNAKDKVSPNKAASDNLQSFITLYGK